jgi:hypothetical protein
VWNICRLNRTTGKVHFWGGDTWHSWAQFARKYNTTAAAHGVMTRRKLTNNFNWDNVYFVNKA